MDPVGIPVTRSERRGSLFYKLLLIFLALCLPPAMMTGARLLTLNQELLTSGGAEWQLPENVVDEITNTLTLEVTAYLTYTLMGISILALFASGEVIGPLNKLKDYVEQLRKDQTAYPAPEKVEVVPTEIHTGDEVEQLAVSFYQLTMDLHILQENLERTVGERTKALERQTRQLQATAAVGRAAVSIRDLDELLSRATVLISEQFNFYHAGIFLMDSNNEFAILRAANSSGGQQMLTSGHKLRLGETSIVGYVANTREPRIALNVGTDAVHFKNPYLPETRSEIALPLVAGDRLWGVLDVQSTEDSAFIQDDMINLQVLADQVAIAIENANLFIENQIALTELQNTLETSRKAYGELSSDAWKKLLRAKSQLGYKCKKLDITTQLVSTAREESSSAGNGEQSAGLSGQTSEDILAPISGDWHLEMVEAGKSGATIHGKENSLAVPIKIRDHIAGVVRLQKSETADDWSKQEITLIETISDQLSVALESARLYEDTRRRAERERLTGEIISKVRASNDPQVILKTAVRELRHALQASRAQALVTEAHEKQAPQPVAQSQATQQEPSTKTEKENQDPDDKQNTPEAQDQIPPSYP